MLGEGCPRPQDLIRQYAEQSSAQITAHHLGHNAHHHHHHHHDVHHNHKESPNTPVRQLSKVHQRSRSIERYGSTSGSGGEGKCKLCIQHSLTGNRRRRVSTPTNVKLKEWFTTINHKWARIKRQVILAHQRQQPLINEDNYGTAEQFSCCHVKSPKSGQILSDLINNSARHDRHHAHNGQCSSSSLAGHHLHHDLAIHCPSNYCYTNYGTALHHPAPRRQQFGRWHEEPAFGSRYAFDTELNSTDSVAFTNHHDKPCHSSSKQEDKENQEDGPIKGDKSTSAQDRPMNRYSVGQETTTTRRAPIGALIKSSSIDTIAVRNIPEQKVLTLLC